MCFINWTVLPKLQVRLKSQIANFVVSVVAIINHHATPVTVKAILLLLCYGNIYHKIVLFGGLLNVIVSYRIVSYRIVSYRIVSYRIVSYRIVSYRIVSYRLQQY